MTLQQLRYLIAIAEFGSINAAAQNLYASQSNLSTAIKELEAELGITIFTRSNRGVTLTNDGTELLGYARQVIQQADMLSERYSKGSSSHARLTVSTQHYAFSVQAFVEVAEMYTGDEYEFTLRECRTGEIIDDVRTFRSEIGILFRDSFNSRVLDKAFADANVVFTPLFDAQVHVFVGEHHPLAKAKILTLDDLEDYPRYSFEQGTENSFYYAEEPFNQIPHKKEIRFSENDPARGCIDRCLSIVPCIFHTHFQKCFVDLLIRFSRHHADTDFGILVNKAFSHRISVKIMDIYHVTIFESTCNRVDFVVENPCTTCFYCAAFTFF